MIGRTPLPAIVKTTAGRVTLQVLDDRHRPYKKELDLPGGSALTVDVELAPKDVSAIVSLRSNVPGARVTVDAKAAGEAPVDVVVSPGAHRLTVESAGYETTSNSVVVRPGERRSMEIQLAKQAPITAKWWFWTGISAVVLGGVAAYVVATTSRPADRGTIGPGQASAPLVRF